MIDIANSSICFQLSITGSDGAVSPMVLANGAANIF